MDLRIQIRLVSIEILNRFIEKIDPRNLDSYFVWKTVSFAFETRRCRNEAMISALV